MPKVQSTSTGKIFNINSQARKFYPTPKPIPSESGIPLFHATKVHKMADPAFNKKPYEFIFQAA